MNDTTIVKDVVQDNVVVARVFWEKKVFKIIQNYEYSKITCETMINELVLMGYDENQVLELLDQDKEWEV